MSSIKSSEEKSKSKTKSKTLESILLKYLVSSNKTNEEFEIRFKRIQKTDFDNVVQMLLSKGFEQESEKDTLKIQTLFTNKQGRSSSSNIRIEINDAVNIQKYCKSTDIINPKNDEIIPNTRFTRKKGIFDENGEKMILDNNDFNFRVSYQLDENLQNTSIFVKKELNDFKNKMKYFRMMKRFSFKHKDLPFIRVDLSEVRTNKKNVRGNMVPTTNVVDSEVFSSNKTYEIEIELDIPFASVNEEEVLKNTKKTIKYILSGIQKTNFPISQKEINIVKNKYMKLVNGEDFTYKWVSPRYFIGSSSISLEMKNVQKNTSSPNIRSPYTVTDKADGKRKLLFITDNGKMYNITTNMSIEFTGIIVNNKTLYNTILDGEHIPTNKDNEYINLYAPFDIYFYNSEDQRTKPFIYYKAEDKKELDDYRYTLLDKCVREINGNMRYISSFGKNMKITRKTFVISNGEKQIFTACKNILDNEEQFEYEIDGLIFTPCDLGVGMDIPGDTTKINTKKTWLHSFKWKPPAFNTVDFLITTIKDTNRKDKINNMYQSGDSSSLTQYKTIELRVGFNEKTHGYTNACKNVIENKLPKYSNIDNNNEYLPVPFIPTNPTNNKTHLCNIMLKREGSDIYMFTEDEQETFEDNTIVEFKYDITKKEGWKWIPIRVRHDKTEEFRNGLKNYGNAYHVAQSVWSSIHNPITMDMIMTGKNIPEFLEDDDVYYNPIGKSQTKALRDFHNLYVKQKLIVGAGKRIIKKTDDDDEEDEFVEKKTLIDLAVGKAGDMSKWIKSNLRFVFGLDISKDNIENRLDGACARYLNYLKKSKGVPKCLFVNADSGKNIKDGTACFDETGKKIVNALNGIGSKSDDIIGKGVRKQYGIAKNGFDVVSCQFAIHYFFENTEKLHNFLRNVSENCKVGGHFIGTSYDGLTVFNKLKDKKIGESINGYKHGKKIWEITKRFTEEEFNVDESSVGIAIDVYQETINKVFQEYLVNYDYLDDLMRLYGFEHIGASEISKMKLPNSTGMFSELFTEMTKEVSNLKRKKKYNGEYGMALELSTDSIQKELTFMNRYFVYKKVNQVNANKIFDSFAKKFNPVLSKIES